MWSLPSDRSAVDDFPESPRTEHIPYQVEVADTVGRPAAPAPYGTTVLLQGRRDNTSADTERGNLAVRLPPRGPQTRNAWQPRATPDLVHTGRKTPATYSYARSSGHTERTYSCGIACQLA